LSLEPTFTDKEPTRLQELQELLAAGRNRISRIGSKWYIIVWMWWLNWDGVPITELEAKTLRNQKYNEAKTKDRRQQTSWKCLDCPMVFTGRGRHWTAKLHAKNHSHRMLHKGRIYRA
jgi:hypothetical protein